MKKILITGGAGFIGSNLVRALLESQPDTQVCNVDCLTYAGNLENLAGVDPERHIFVKADIADAPAMESVFAEQGPLAAVVNVAADSHVDRSIASAAPFIHTNILGSQVLLDLVRKHEVPTFLQVSTDEVYGSLDAPVEAVETTPLQPGNPYAASKAAADLLALAAVNTFGLDVRITRCCNNYGPYQFPEKLIPLLIGNARDGIALPIYGDGKYIREWIHVEDHCAGILAVLNKGRPGQIYNLGSNQPLTNLEVAAVILEAFGRPSSLIRHVQDRPGHDRRYAIDSSKARGELGWQPRWQLDAGLAATIAWYKEQETWLDHVRSGAYREYYQTWYERRDTSLEAL